MYAEAVVDDHLSGGIGDVVIKHLYNGAYGHQAEGAVEIQNTGV